MLHLKDQELISVSTEEIIRLKECEAKLEALESAGVECWEGYEDALELMELERGN